MITAIVAALVTGAIGLAFYLARGPLSRLLNRPPPSAAQQIGKVTDAQKKILADADATGVATADDLQRGKY